MFISRHSQERIQERGIDASAADDIAARINNGILPKKSAVVLLGTDSADSYNKYLVSIIRYQSFSGKFVVVTTMRTNSISTQKHRVDVLYRA